MTAIFRINQDSTGTYGEARRDLQLSSESGLVTVEAQDLTHSSYTWEVISAPEGSAAVFVPSGSPATSATIDLDVQGSYLFRLTVDTGLPTEDLSALFGGIPLPNSGVCVPAFNESNQDNFGGNTRGYGPKLVDFIVWADGAAGGGGVGGIFETGSGTYSAQRIDTSNAADGDYSFAMGLSNTVAADFSTTFGGDNTVGGVEHNTAIGYDNAIQGESAFNFVAGSLHEIGLSGGGEAPVAYLNAVFGTLHSVDGGCMVNHVSGAGHQLVDSFGCLVACAGIAAGEFNTLTDSNSNIVAGTTHTLAQSDYNAVFGITVSTTESDNNLVAGSAQTLNSSSYNAVFGTTHNVLASDYNVVGGDGNTLNNVDKSLVGGADIVLTNSFRSVVAGNDQTLSAFYNSVIVGDDNYVGNAFNSAIVGEDNNLRANNSFVGGDNNVAGTGVFEGLMVGAHSFASRATGSVHFGQSNNVGVGNPIASFAVAGDTVTITSTGFSPEIDGEAIAVYGATSDSNNVYNVTVTYISSTQVSYENSGGIAELGNGNTLWTMFGYLSRSVFGGAFNSLPQVYDSIVIGEGINCYSAISTDHAGIRHSAIFGQLHSLGQFEYNIIGGTRNVMPPHNYLANALAVGSYHSMLGEANLYTGTSNTSTWFNEGVTISFSQSGTTTTLTDTSGPFKAEMDGHDVYVDGAVTASNDVDGVEVTYISATQISFENASGADDGSTPVTTWRIGEACSNSYLGGRLNETINVRDSIIHGVSNTVGGLDVSSNLAVFGYGHAISAANYVLVSGYANTLTSTEESLVAGSDNTVAGTYVSLVVGDSHNVVDGRGTTVLGQGNTATGALYSMIAGYGNEVVGGQYNLVGGYLNTLAGAASNNLVVGQENILNGAPNHCLIGGSQNQYDQGANRVLCMGNQNRAEYGPADIFHLGQYHRTHGSRQMMCGQYHSSGPFNTGASLSLVKGTGDEMTLNLGGLYGSQYMVGYAVTLSGAVSSGNNGSWTITGATSSTLTFDIAGDAGVDESGNDDLAWRVSSMSGSSDSVLFGFANSVHDNAYQYGVVTGQYNFAYQGAAQGGSLLAGEYCLAGALSSNTVTTGRYADASFRQLMHIHSGGNPADSSATAARGQGQLLDRIPHSITTTDATSTVLWMDGALASKAFDLVNHQDQAYLLVSYLIAKCVETGSVKGWKFESLVNDIAGTPAIISSVATSLGITNPAVGSEASWTAAVALSGTSLTFTVAGAASETVRWQAYSMGPEVGIN